MGLAPLRYWRHCLQTCQVVVVLVHWVAASNSQDLPRDFIGAVEQLGLEIDPEFSSSVSIHTREREGRARPLPMLV